jgi:hypothetical protein
MDDDKKAISVETEATTEQLMASGIEVLQIRKGDTVLVRANASTNEQLMFITAAFGAVFEQRGLGPEDVSLLILPGNLDVKVMDAQQMRSCGWVRATRIVAPGNGLKLKLDRV